MQKTKILFNILNISFIVLYIYPGSILGYLFYGKIYKQPQLTDDFMSISSNHVYAYLLLSILALAAYYKSNKIIILNYLILSSIILEVLHLVIPNRSFQYGDLFGNIIGVLISILIFWIFNYLKKNEYF